MDVLYFLTFLSLNVQVDIFWDKSFLRTCWDHSQKEWLAAHRDQGTSLMKQVRSPPLLEFWFLSVMPQVHNSLWPLVVINVGMTKAI